MMLQPPSQGEPVDELWRYVAALTARVNALSDMQAAGALTGKVLCTGDHAVLVLQPKE